VFSVVQPKSQDLTDLHLAFYCLSEVPCRTDVKREDCLLIPRFPAGEMRECNIRFKWGTSKTPPLGA
jgi:hypothetical protein